MLIIFSVLFVLFFSLICRAAYIMIVQSKRFTEIAKEQWTSRVVIDAKRGRILDSGLNELAMSANVYRVDLDMNTLRVSLENKGLTNDTLAPRLAAALNMDGKDVLKILNKTLPSGLPMASATLARRIEKDAADKVRDVISNPKIKGVNISPDTKRFYPNNNFLAHVLGHTDIDGNGLTGVEKQYNDILKGKPGQLLAESDRDRNELPYNISEFTTPIDGKDIILTVDQSIQAFCEKAAQQALIDNKAKAVSIVVMDPKTGSVLAMVNKPDYNPNMPWETGKSEAQLNAAWRNRGVSDAFEPGSIFKVITSLAAITEKTKSINDSFNCGGSTTVLNRNIKCWKTTGHGQQDFVDILKNSCNVGFIKVGLELGIDRLTKYVSLVGFGQKTGIDLPGETKGIVKDPKTMTQLDLATMAFGQVNAISCIQYLTAFNAVANGGYLIQPHVLKAVGHTENNKEIIDENYKINKKQILDADATAVLRGNLEKVVSEGGGKKAYIDGYHIGGKTGTANKPGTGGYAEGKYVSSFAGMAPTNDPQITLIVQIDEPDTSNYFGGMITTPVAKDVFNNIFNYLALKIDASKEDVARSLLKDVPVPNVRGMKKADAIKVLKDNHINYVFDGEGDYVLDTSPIPGISVKEGDKITVYMGVSPTVTNKMVAVPDLRGYNKDKAVELLKSLGLVAEFQGVGMVSEQNIEPGTQVSKGSNVIITLETVGD